MTAPPEPLEVHDQGAVWEAEPFEIAADWSARTLPVVLLDDRTLTPATARRVAAALLAAADRAEEACA